MDGRRNNKGTTGNKGGRKPRADEQKLIEHLTPMATTARKQLHTAIKAGEKWAIELFFNYYYGRPKQNMDLTTNGESINIPPIKWSE